MAVAWRPLLGPDRWPDVPDGPCTVCGWWSLSAGFVYADAWRGFRRRLDLAYRTRVVPGVCLWCRARGRTE